MGQPAVLMMALGGLVYRRATLRSGVGIFWLNQGFSSDRPRWIPFSPTFMPVWGGRNTIYYRPGHHPMGDEMFGAGMICSKSSSEHLPGNSEHLPGNSEHLDTLRNIAEPIRSLRKAPRERIKAMILRLCESRYLTLDELADLLDRRKDSFRNHYINPLLEDGRIEPRYKNIRNHPRQGYRTAAGMEVGGEGQGGL